jgi:biotin carboxylase
MISRQTSKGLLTITVDTHAWGVGCTVRLDGKLVSGGPGEPEHLAAPVTGPTGVVYTHRVGNAAITGDEASALAEAVATARASNVLRALLTERARLVDAHRDLSDELDRATEARDWERRSVLADKLQASHLAVVAWDAAHYGLTDARD